jgi:CBS domain-containing protein
MPDKFNMQSPPFDRLTTAQQQQLTGALDIAYFRARERILRSGQPSHVLHILIKGLVEERTEDGLEIFAHYANDDIFDVRSLFDGTVKHQYVALEDTLSYQLPKSLFLQFYEQNGQFAAYFDNNLAKRQALIEAAQQQKNLGEFILTRVDQSIYHPPLLLSPKQTIDETTRQLKDHHYDAALVHFDDQPNKYDQAAKPDNVSIPHAHPYAIITRTDLLHALTLDGLAPTTPVGEIATYPVLHVDEGEYLFNAMVMMIRNKVKRVMVCEGHRAVGMLDMTQILSTFSTHSHVLTLSIARASSLDELVMAANQQRKLVNNLMRHGIRTRFMMELISAVNEQIIEKAFELIVPPAMSQHCCLLVLGSEGRGEQILKTDQDNALILADHLHGTDCQEMMEQLTHTLLLLGYPLCPGKVMVNNPDWVKSQAQWIQTLDQWVQSAQPAQMMNLAIMADAHPVAGDKHLLSPIKTHLTRILKEKELLLTEFTRPAINFSVPLTLFGNVKTSKSGLDIKQGGIFPIVHGIRALCLEHQIEPTNTFKRIEVLAQQRVLEQETADNLSEALKLFFKLRLEQQLNRQHTDNRLNLNDLDRTERDLLRHSLHVVKKFKQWLGYHYQIRE